MILHAGLLATWTQAGWAGALIEGASGAGKSDLALRALDAGFRLVADDRTRVWESAGRLFGRAPDTLEGLIEVRGLDVVREPALDFCEIRLLALCEAAERIPDDRVAERVGVRLPVVSIAPLEASAPAKLRRALQHLGAGPEGAYLAARAGHGTPRRGGETR